MYSGIVDFRLKNFAADNSLNAVVNFGEVNIEDLGILKKLSDTRQLGMIICPVEMLEDLRELIKQAKDV